MFNKKLTHLETRKQLLIAESQLNRILLLQEREALISETSKVTEPLRHMGSIFSTVAEGMALFKEWRKGGGQGEGKGLSWLASGAMRMVLAFVAGRKGSNGSVNHNHDHAESVAD